ncbi:MAG TPA: MFS transporter [Jatrophihabitantaceae bacterium]|jgi:MFS family permease
MTAQLDRAHEAEVLVDDITVLPEPSQSQPTSGATLKLSPIGLLILLCGGFLPVLDFFIVNVALPTMDTTLHASAPMLELVVAGYGTAYAVMLVVGGRLGDAFGRDRMFVAGITGFTISSLLCGIAPNVQILIVARIAQGLSAAMSQPQVLATFQSTLDGPKRARAIGLYASMGGIAASLGQLLGGALVHADIAGLSWRPIFLVNVPIGVAVLLLTRRFVPATRSPSPASVDLPGTALLAIAIVGLLVPLTEGRVLHWPVWIWALLAVSAAAATAMVIVERRTERSGRTPLVPPSLVSLRSMRRGLTIAIPFFMGFGAFMFVFALTVQNGLHESALESGIAISPMAVAFFAGTLVAPRLIARHGRLVVVAGLGLQAVGLVWLIDVMHGEWPHVSTLAMAAPLAVAGIGQAFALVGFFRIILADVPGRLAGIGSGVLVTMQQGSLALGIASLGTLFVSLADGSGGMRHAFTVVIGIQAAIAVAVGLLALRLPDPE